MYTKLPFETAYQNIMSFASPQIKEIVAREIPKIEKSIDDEIVQFGAELGEFIQKSLDDEAKRIQESAVARVAQIRGAIAIITSETVPNPGLAELVAAANTLTRELDEQKEFWSGAGESVKSLVLSKIKAVGLPLL